MRTNGAVAASACHAGVGAAVFGGGTYVDGEGGHGGRLFRVFYWARLLVRVWLKLTSLSYAACGGALTWLVVVGRARTRGADHTRIQTHTHTHP